MPEDIFPIILTPKTNDQGPNIMKRLIVLFGCVFLLFGGCQELSRNKSKVEVITKGGKEFPEFLVGRWKEKGKEYGEWEFVFEPDGTISSGRAPIWKDSMIPGQVNKFPTRGGGEAVFEAGNWTVDYESSTRTLEVYFVLDNFYTEMGKNAMKGHSEDIFIGPVSQNGKEWTAEWYSFPKRIMYLASKSEWVDLPVDYNDNPMYTLIFTKMASEE